MSKPRLKTGDCDIVGSKEDVGVLIPYEGIVRPLNRIVKLRTAVGSLLLVYFSLFPFLQSIKA
jgi:hypothetical protein